MSNARVLYELKKKTLSQESERLETEIMMQL